MARKGEIEILRIIGSFGIVWFHAMSYGRGIAYAGLVSFLIISVYFSAIPGARVKPVAERAKRLLLPWLIWFIAYGTLNLIVGKPFMDSAGGIVSAILAGTSLHLWYLPFIFIFLVLLDLARKAIPEKALAYAFMAATLVFFLTTPYWRTLQCALPLPQYLHASGAVFCGVVLANARTVPRVALVAFTLLLLSAIVLVGLPYSGVGLTYLVGISATAFVLMPDWNVNAPKWVLWVSECTMGIYLTHVIWIKALGLFGVPELAVPFIAFTLSLLSVGIFKKALPQVSRHIL